MELRDTSEGEVIVKVPNFVYDAEIADLERVVLDRADLSRSSQ